MDPWQSILLAFGGNAALLLVLGWLARSFGSQLLAKDLEKFKAELAANSSAASDRLKHDLHLVALEHQVRFSKLHERRAEVVAEAYALLVEAHWSSADFVSPIEYAGDSSKQEKYVNAMKKGTEFYRYFDKNRIYLPQALCDQLQTFIQNMRREVVGFGVYVTNDEEYVPDHAIRSKLEAWTRASKFFDSEVPSAKAALEAELRTIIGAS